MIIYTAGSVVFKKSLIVKVFSICLSISKLRPSFFKLRVKGLLALKWSCGGGGRTPPNYCLAVLCSSTVCVYEMRAQPCVAVQLRDKGVVKNEDRGW